jgi:lactate dehydrogenase-like 2-hydroxyacid dehydrogenase
MNPEVLQMGPMYAPTQKQMDESFTLHKLWLAADRDAMIKAVAGHITAVATSGKNGIDGATIARLPKVKIISHFGVGVDTVDVDAAKKHGVTVTNTPDVLTEDVADIALVLLLSTVRRIAAGDRYVREGKWLKGPMALTDTMQGKTLGVVGMGRIGRAIARRAEAFNLKIAYQGPNNKKDVAWPYYADPVALARDVDFLVAACPGGEATKGLVSRAALEALGPTGVFVNISRGSVADQPAMVELLKAGKLGGAGLDVFTDEPKVPEEFFAMDNVVLAPHVGSATHPTRAAMGQLVVDNLKAFFAGRALLTPY